MKQVQPEPPVHGTTAPELFTSLQSMLQHWLLDVQAWPSLTQVELPEPLPLPVVPPHVPYVMPGW